MAAWQDGKGRQWVVVPFYGPVSREFKAPVEHARPTNGGVAAYTLEERDGKWQLVPQWLSRDMDLAEHAIVANGVIFTYGSGEDASQIVPDRAFDDPAGPQIGGAVSTTADRRIPGPARDAVRARRVDRARTLEQRQRDHHVEPLQRPDGRQRPRLSSRHSTARSTPSAYTQLMTHSSFATYPLLLRIICALGGRGRMGAGTQRRLRMAGDQRRRAAHVVASAGSEHLGRELVEAGIPASVAGEAGQRSSPVGVAQPGRHHERPARLFAGVVRHRGVEQRLRASTTTPATRCGIAVSTAPLPAPTSQCPGGMTGAAGRVVSLVPPALPLPAPAPPRAGYRGGIGQPGEGVPMEIARRDGGAGLRGARPHSQQHVAAAAAFSRAGTPGRSTRCRVPARCTRSARTPASMCNDQHRSFRANARYSDLTAVGDMLYTSTSEGCGGVPEWRLGDHAGCRQQDRSARGKRMAAVRSAISRSPPAASCSSPSAQAQPAPAATPMRSSRWTRKRCSRPTGSRARQPSL